jgi:hypothetical protein
MHLIKSAFEKYYEFNEREVAWEAFKTGG